MVYLLVFPLEMFLLPSININVAGSLVNILWQHASALFTFSHLRVVGFSACSRMENVHPPFTQNELSFCFLTCIQNCYLCLKFSNLFFNKKELLLWNHRQLATSSLFVCWDVATNPLTMIFSDNQLLVLCLVNTIMSYELPDIVLMADYRLF